MIRILICLFISVAFLKADNTVKPIFVKDFTISGQVDFEFNLERWGRVSLQAESPEGVELQLMDKKQGVRRKDGTAGQRNGRIDEYLDVGTYKIIANAAHNSTSKAKISVYPFVELNPPQYLQKNKEYRTELNDFQIRSYWIEVPDTMTVILEALGRNLSDVQFWQDGQWRIDLAVSPIKSLQNTDTPLKGYRVVQSLKKGYYLVSFYGGPSIEWTKKSDKSPLYIKWGLTPIGSTGIRTDTIGPQGYNQYMATGNLSCVLLSTAQIEKMYLEKIPFYVSNPRWNPEKIDSIHEKSVEPRAIVEGKRTGPHVIRVSGTPGKVFTLMTLDDEKAYSMVANGSYWISSLSSQTDDHQFGISGYIVNDSREQKIISMCLDTVSDKKAIKREFNLLQNISAYVWVDENATYIANLGKIKYEVRITRFFSDTKSSINESFDSKKKLSLTRGLYKLTFTPEEKGIATFEFYKSDMIGSISSMVFKDKMKLDDSKRLFWQIPSISLENGKYSLYLNSLAPEFGGLIIRKLPMDLNDPLPVRTIKGTSVPVSIRVDKKSYLNVTDSRGKHYSFTLSGKRCSSPFLLEEGEYSVEIDGSGEYLQLHTVALEHLPGFAPRPFPTGKESPLTVFPLITENKAAYFQLNREDFAVYEVVVKSAGIYNLTTSGRLRTELKLRDRFTTSMFVQEANGIGRNALINAYLLPGTYQAVVSTKGKSAGRLGFHLERGNMIDGTELILDREKRFNVRAGDGISFSVPIKEQGTYHFYSYCQDGYFSIRLDDAQGWPVVTPGSMGNISVNLKKGTYSLLSLPDKRTRLRISKFSQLKKSSEYAGWGPHTLKINEPAASIWNNDSLPQTGKPVVFNFSNPVSLKYTASLTERFTALFINKSTGDTTRHKGTAELFLKKGNYVIHVYADENKRHEPYQLVVTTDVLTEGDAFTFYPSEKKEIKVAVGKSSVVELYSEGRVDVDGTLTDSTGNLIAYNDDNSLDWNFTISRLLHPGTYILTVTPKSKDTQSQITVGMSALKDSTHKLWTSHNSVSLNLNHKIHSIPINTDSLSIISAVIQGRSKVGACLEKVKDSKHLQIGHEEGELVSISAPVTPKSTYYLHVWSVDHIHEDVTVNIIRHNPEQIPYKKLVSGFTLENISNGPLDICWYRVDMQSDSILRFSFDDLSHLSHIKTSDSRDRSFTPVIQSEVQSYKRYLWLELASAKRNSKKIKATAVKVPEKKEFTIDHRPVTYQMTTDNSSISVIKAEMKPGYPVCGVVSSKNDASVFPLSVPVQPGSITLDNCAVTAVLPNESKTVVLWNGNQDSRHQAPTVTVSHRLFNINSRNSLPVGFTSWKASPYSATAWTVDFQNPALLEITIPQDGLCIWESKEGKREIWPAFDRFSRFTHTMKKGTLFFVNYDNSSEFSVNCLLFNKSFSYADQSYSNSVSNISFKSTLKGIKRIPIINNWNGDSTVTLYYSDQITDVIWYRGNGSVVTALKNKQELKFSRQGKEGFLQIAFNPGDHQIVLCPDNVHSCFWGEEIKSDANEKITGPSILNLVNRISWFKYSTKKPEQITVKSNEAIACVIAHKGKAIRTFTSPYGINGTVPLAPGDYTIGIRMNSNSGGNAAVTFLDIPELREEKENHLSLSSGETFFMHLKLAEKRRIGIGIPTDDEVFDLALYNKDLEEIATGKQVFTQLDKGTYYIGISIPYHQNAASCKLNLVGQNPLPDTPPQEVINYYLQFKDE